MRQLEQAAREAIEVLRRQVFVDYASAKAATNLETALAQPANNGWQPIETAPKDGTPFDVWVKSTKNTTYGVRMAEVYFSNGVICGRRFPDASFGEYASHWMPLPTSPEVKK